MADLINVLTEDDIEKIVSSLARKISSDYKGKDLVCVGVLKGAFIFMADLVRLLTVPVTIEFLRASSYGSGMSSSGRPELTSDLAADIKGKLQVSPIRNDCASVGAHQMALHSQSIQIRADCCL